MKKLFILLVLLIGAQGLQAQIERTTYPVDSCLYFMTPFSFTIKNTVTNSNGAELLTTVFQSSSSSGEQQYRGRGRFQVWPDSISSGLVLEIGDMGNLFLSMPNEEESPGGSGNGIPGGPLPYPLMVNGFFMKYEGIEIDPPIPISMQVVQLQILSNSE